MDVKKPFLFKKYFTSSDLTPLQPIANATLLDITAIVDDASFDVPMRLISLDLAGATMQIAGRQVGVKSFDLKFRFSLLGTNISIAEINQATFMVIGYKSKMNFAPGFIFDTFKPFACAIGLGLDNLATYTPAGAIKFRYTIGFEYYKESEYQKYLRSLEENENQFG